jgi:hypothetical protein
MTIAAQVDAAREKFNQNVSRLTGARKTIAKAKKTELKTLVHEHQTAMHTVAISSLDKIIAGAEQIVDRAKKAKTNLTTNSHAFVTTFAFFHALFITENLHAIAESRTTFATAISAIIETDKFDEPDAAPAAKAKK